ncbi:MAG: hypothetical protein WA624_04300 [Methylocella sp.]
MRQEPDIVLDRERDTRLYLGECALDEGQEVLVQNGDKKVAIWHFDPPQRGWKKREN